MSHHGITELEVIESGEGTDGEGGTQFNDSESDEIGRSSHSTSSFNPNPNPTSYYEPDDIDLIYDEDLSDVNNNISLGNSAPSGSSDGDDSSTEFVELEVCGESQPSYRKGYIDDEIVADVMRNADARLNANNPRRNTKLIAYCVGITSVLMIIIALSLPLGRVAIENYRIEEKIKEKGTAYDFDDRNEYEQSIASETIEAEEAIQTNTVMKYPTPLHDVIFPPWIDHYLVEPFKDPIKEGETPFFWQVPFAGEVFQSFMTACNKKVLASNQKMINDNTMVIHKVADHEYVNVDLSTTSGIERAAQLRLPESGLAEVIVSTKLQLATTALFDAVHKGRLFTALRHPVDRSISEYYFSKRNDPQFKDVGLEQFVYSKHMQENWMTRSLVNKPKLPLVKEDLSLAKEILRQRCVVGLHEHIALSLDLFEQYFGWTAEADFTENAQGYSAQDLKDAVHAHDTCKQDVLEKELSYARDIHALVGTIDEGVYSKIVQKNEFDMELFWYANYLFEEQRRLVNADANTLDI